jgi:RimJ/RimL family protein N-acetyltransferase
MGADLPAFDFDREALRDIPDAFPVLMSGRWLALRPIRQDDYRPLYELARHEHVAYRWQYSGTTPTIDTFVRELQGPAVWCQFAVTRREKDEPVGLVTAYRADLRGGTVYIGAMLAPPLQGTGAGVDAFALLLRYLISNWNFRKFYLEVVAYNLREFKSMIGRYATVEGVLTKHHYFQGRYWDYYILALTRDKVEEGLCRFLGGMEIPAPHPD